MNFTCISFFIHVLWVSNVKGPLWGQVIPVQEKPPVNSLVCSDWLFHENYFTIYGNATNQTNYRLTNALLIKSISLSMSTTSFALNGNRGLGMNQNNCTVLILNFITLFTKTDFIWLLTNRKLPMWFVLLKKNYGLTTLYVFFIFILLKQIKLLYFKEKKLK